MPTVHEKSKASNVTIKLDATDRSRLKSLAVSKKRTPHYLMKEAIQAYLDKEEAERAVLARVDYSIDHYETTGLHVTLDEMRTWSKALRLDPNAHLPTCHK
jgi:predicted transcriptional regulator